LLSNSWNRQDFSLTVKSHVSTIYLLLLFYFASNWTVRGGVCCWILGLQFPNTKVRLDLIRKLTSSLRYKKAQNQLIHPQTQCTTNILHAPFLLCSGQYQTISSFSFPIWIPKRRIKWWQGVGSTIIFMNDRQWTTAYMVTLVDPRSIKVIGLHNFSVSDHTHHFCLSYRPTFTWHIINATGVAIQSINH
jgi:hypothetical protein